jgi:hypothetical protein
MRPFVFLGAMIDDKPVVDPNGGLEIVCRRKMALIKAIQEDFM